MITVQEAIDKFGSVTAINEELKRNEREKVNHRAWARWGNVERKERYKLTLAYEKVLKQAKKQLKDEYNNMIVVTPQAIKLYNQIERQYACTCTAVTAQRYINQLEAGKTPNVDGLFSFWFNNL